MEAKEIKTEGLEEEKQEGKIREIAVPGEKIVSGDDFLPGDWTRREGKDIIASRYGIVEKQGRLVRIIPVSGVYVPRRGNIVIGQVIDIVFNGWILDINAPYNAFLSAMEAPRFINKNELSEYFGFRDLVVAKVENTRGRGIDLSLKSKNLGKLEDGMAIFINSNKVPRVIGKEGSMINLIKEYTGCDIIVGQNGIIWIHGKNLEEEMVAKEAIMFITEKATIFGLTEAVKEFLEKRQKTEEKA